jgi:hypothetical protein
MFRRLFHSLSKPAQILHVTDNEGTRFLFEVIQKSKIVDYHPDKGLSFAKISGEPYFVFGGDATDRGRFDLATLEILLAFKNKYPDNVILLAGNRDIKQNRFKIELAENLIRDRLLLTSPPRWLSLKVQTVPLDYVKKEMQDLRMPTDDIDVVKDYIASLTTTQCQLIYLHWMLEKNMGSPHTFRYRREELVVRLGKNQISDEEVLQSFLMESAVDGLSGEYLKHAQIGAIIPETRVMVVHGGLTAENIGRIPGMRLEDPMIQNASDWLQQFNQWYKAQIKKWVAYAPNELTVPGFTDLDASVLPIPGSIKYIMTADMLGKEREFIEVPGVVDDYLTDNSISLILTGHQPCGDHPAIRRGKSHPLLFIDGDTGYGKGDLSNPDDTRGKAFHTLEITADRQKTCIDIAARLANGESVITHLTVSEKDITGDYYIGKLLSDHRLVQCRLGDGNYRLITQQGFKDDYSIVTPSELENLINSETACFTTPSK